MRQWLFVLTGGFGSALTAAAVAAVALDAVPPLAPSAAMAWAEAAVGAGGAVLGCVGYAGARRSGRRAVADWAARNGLGESDGADRPAAEIAFACPTCGRAYRASSACLGGPFACRTCAAVFAVRELPRTHWIDVDVNTAVTPRAA